MMPHATENTAIIRIRELHIAASIGVYDHEKQAARDLSITITAEIPAQYATPKKDALNEVVNYEALVNAAHAVAQSTQTQHIHLLETFCQKVADECLKIHPILAVHICVEKHHAIDKSLSSAVEIYRKRSNSDSPHLS